MGIQWESVKLAAFTAIRLEMSVAQLLQLAREGSDTPVSGDALALRKEGIE